MSKAETVAVAAIAGAIGGALTAFALVYFNVRLVQPTESNK